MSSSVRLDGLFVPARLSAWTAEKQKQIRQGVSDGMRASGPVVVERLRTQMRQAFKIKRPAFLKVMQFRVFDTRPDRMPSMQVGALRAQWLESHEVGATIRAKSRGLLIPFPGVERGKRFRRLVNELFRLGAAHFAMVRGRVILFAEHQREFAKLTRRARGGLTKAIGGGRLKAGADVPIAVLVPQVQLRRRLRVQDTARASVPMVAAAIERAMRLKG